MSCTGLPDHPDQATPDVASGDMPSQGAVRLAANDGGEISRGARPAASRATGSAGGGPPTAKQPGRSQAIAVCGAHMSGLPLNGQLTDLGGIFLTATRTAEDYRLFALDEFSPPRPGLVRVGSDAGAAIDIEVWALPTEQVGPFLQHVLPPLCIGHVALADGGTVHGFLCEAHATAGARDITAFGGWRQFLSQSAAADN